MDVNLFSVARPMLACVLRWTCVASVVSTVAAGPASAQNCPLDCTAWNALLSAGRGAGDSFTCTYQGGGDVGYCDDTEPGSGFGSECTEYQCQNIACGGFIIRSAADPSRAEPLRATLVRVAAQLPRVSFGQSSGDSTHSIRVQLVSDVLLVSRLAVAVCAIGSVEAAAQDLPALRATRTHVTLGEDPNDDIGHGAFGSVGKVHSAPGGRV